MVCGLYIVRYSDLVSPNLLETVTPAYEQDSKNMVFTIQKNLQIKIGFIALQESRWKPQFMYSDDYRAM